MDVEPHWTKLKIQYDQITLSFPNTFASYLSEFSLQAALKILEELSDIGLDSIKSSEDN
jgi:hypothetical protein